MDWKRHVKKYGAVAALLAIGFITSAELRPLVWVIDALGVDVILMLIGFQLRMIFLMMPGLATRIRAMTCIAAYGFLRMGARVFLIFTPCGRATFGLSLLLVVATKILWCPSSLLVPSLP